MRDTIGSQSGSRPCTLYRYFDRRGHLLYVGITIQGSGRLVDHASQSEWWPLVATATFKHYRSVTAAEWAERAAIMDESPLWNKKHRTPWWPASFAEAAERIEAMPQRKEGYTLEDYAAATGMRADHLRLKLAEVGIRPRSGRYYRKFDILAFFLHTLG